MPRRVKPSTAVMTDFIEKEYSMSKTKRQALIDAILDQYKQYSIKPRDIHMLAKSRLRERGIIPVTKEEMTILDDEVNKLTQELKNYETKLPELLKLNGNDNDGVYADKNDHELCQRFFNQLEQAVDNFLQDEKFDRERPNKSEVVERLRLIGNACRPLENELQEIDDYSRAFLHHNLQIDVDELIASLHDLQAAYDFSKTIDAGKQNTATLYLCVAVAKALQSIGLRATTSREGLFERFTLELLNVTKGIKAPQIQKTIRLALTML